MADGWMMDDGGWMMDDGGRDDGGLDGWTWDDGRLCWRVGWVDDRRVDSTKDRKRRRDGRQGTGGKGFTCPPPLAAPYQLRIRLRLRPFSTPCSLACTHNPPPPPPHTHTPPPQTPRSSHGHWSGVPCAGCGARRLGSSAACHAGRAGAGASRRRRRTCRWWRSGTAVSDGNRGGGCGGTPPHGSFRA